MENDPEHINPWTTLSDKLIYDNPWIRINEYNVINPGGGKGIYGKIHYKNLGIGIVPLDDDLNIWLVGQYRYACDEYSWEIPEGGGHLDKEPLDSAKRELLEETGMTAEHWEKILEMRLSNSVSDEFAIIFLARNFTFSKASPEETEKLVLKKVSLDEAYRMVTEGIITDSMTVAGVLKIKLMLAEGKISVANGISH